MNDDPFERRRSNRAVLMVVGLAFAAMALNQGVHALSAPAAHREPARHSTPRPERAGDSPCDDSASR
jgi:hypothetical protein